MKTTILSFLFAWVALAAGNLRAEDTPSGKPTNLLFIFADQWRGSALGFLGHEPVLTPNLDKLSREGLVLTHCVSSYPVCSPYRAMLMTGQFPQRNRVMGNCNTDGAKHGYELQADARCWSDVLKEKGYGMGYIGKWHLDSPHEPYVDTYNNSPKFAWNEWTPPNRRHGFDFWYAYGTFDRHLHPQYWTTDAPREKRTKVDQWGPEHEADLAIRYLKNDGGQFRDSKKPFALVVSMNPPHTPYEQVPKNYVDLYRDKDPNDLVKRPNLATTSDENGGKLAKKNIKNYFACMTGVDDQVGRILAALKAEGLDENTLIVFTSDHGNCLGAHNEGTKNVAWDESLIVPFIAKLPGKIPVRRDDLLLTPPDIAPTLLALLGFSHDIPTEMQGTDYSTIFHGGEGKRPTSAWYLFTPIGKPELGRRGIRTQTHTLVWHRDGKSPDRHELYDNVADPFQTKDIAKEQPKLVEKLTEEELVPWLKKMDDPWLKNEMSIPQ